MYKKYKNNRNIHPTRILLNNDDGPTILLQVVFLKVV